MIFKSYLLPASCINDSQWGIEDHLTLTLHQLQKKGGRGVEISLNVLT